MIDPLGDLWLLVLLRDSFQKRCFIHEFIKTKSACFVKWCALSCFSITTITVQDALAVSLVGVSVAV